jgi:uncharacterized protein
MNELFKNKKVIIGVIHLLPTPGFKGFLSKEETLKRALDDLKILEISGVDAVIIENNYDTPHVINISSQTFALMDFIINKMRSKTTLPLGISVLWNDFKSALLLAKKNNCQFIRVPVFVDYIKSSCGEIKGDADKVITFRNKINAKDILLLTDIQVKHSELLNIRPISLAAIDAVNKGSDGIIITGVWTGKPPSIEDLKIVKEVSKNIPIIIGSGADKFNIKTLLKFADAVIVSTSLKEGAPKSSKEEVNIKSYDTKISLNKVKEFINKARY